MDFYILQSLNRSHFEQMHNLELHYYEEEFITPADEAYAWYLRYPYSTVAATNNQGNILGFVNLFPVKPTIFKQIERGTFNDASLKVDDIVNIAVNHNEPLYMFLSCIVISEAARGKGVTEALLLAATEQYEIVAHRCQTVITDNITQAGQRFSVKYGFKKQQLTNHNSSLFKQSYSDFVKTIQTHAQKARCRK